MAPPLGVVTSIHGFNELGHLLHRSPSALRVAHSIGLLPIHSEVRAGVRVFDRAAADVVAGILGINEVLL